MIDETDPLVRAARARFAGIAAEFGDRLDAARRDCRDKLAAIQERPAPQPVRRPRPEPDDPSDTGVFTVSWMTKGAGH